MFRTTILFEHEEKAMDLLVKETIWYRNFGKCMKKIFHMECLTLEQELLLSEAILDCALAKKAVGDIMYLIEMRQWCDSQDNLSLILNGYRLKFHEELSKTADKVTLFKSYFDAFEIEAECLDTDDFLFHRRYEKYEIEALFALSRECTVSQNENLDIITKNPELSTKKRKCPFVQNEYGTESHKTPKIHPDNIFAGNESILMDRRKPESSKAMELLLEEAMLYDGYEQCMDKFARNKNLTWEQKELISEVRRKFDFAYIAVADLIYQVEMRQWCDNLDNLFVIINGFRTDVDKELSKIADKVTQFRNYFEAFKIEAKLLRGSYLYPHHEYFQIKAAIVESRLHPVSQNQNPDFITKNLSPVIHADLQCVVDDDDDYEDLLS